MPQKIPITFIRKTVGQTVCEVEFKRRFKFAAHDFSRNFLLNYKFCGTSSNRRE